MIQQTMRLLHSLLGSCVALCPLRGTTGGLDGRGRMYASRRLQSQIPFTLALSSLLSILLSFPAQAQLAEPRPTVARALDLIADHSSPIFLGAEVVFTQKPNLSARARALIRSGVQARVFSLEEGEKTPKPIATVGKRWYKCNVYISTVHRLLPTPGGGLRFAKMDSGWVNLTHSRRSTKPGRWFLVFEQLGAPQEQFRIKASDVSAYFETGFIITVQDNGSVPLEQISAEYKKRSDNLARLYEEVDSNDSSVPCYSYSSIRASFEAGAVVAYGEIEGCAKSDKAYNPMMQRLTSYSVSVAQRGEGVTPNTGAPPDANRAIARSSPVSF